MDKRIRDFIKRCSEDFEFFARHCLKIRVKLPNGGTQLMPFLLNREQKVVVAWMYHCIRQGLPFRIIIDKCRKLGMSTLAEGIGYWLCAFRPLFRATVIAQSETDTKVIAAIAKTFNAYLPDLMAPYAGKPSGNYIKWKDPRNPEGEGSWFRAATQGAVGAGRGDDPSFLHISELATWDQKRGTSSAEDALLAYLGSIPAGPWTFVILESTAEGQSGSFFERFTGSWKLWHDPGVRQEAKEWRPFFFSWQGVPKYTKDVPADLHESWEEMRRLAAAGKEKKAKSAWAKMPWTRALEKHELNGLWYDRMVDYGITASQMAWAAGKLAEFQYDIDRFDQEFPLSWQLSFVTSGRPVMPQRIIGKWMEKDWDLDIQTGSEFYDGGAAGILLNDFGGSWEVYREPNPDHEYIVATDSAEGGDDGDYAACRVFNRNTREIVAEHYGKIAPDLLGHQAVLACKKYNDAYFIPEINNHGYVTVDTAVNHLGYPHVHTRIKGRDVKPGTPWTQIWGWKTTSSTKPQMIGELVRQVRTEGYLEYSKRWCDEATTYIYNRHGKPDHMRGKHDDLLDCTALIFQADREMNPAEIRTPTLTEDSVPNDFYVQQALSRTRERAYSKKRHAAKPLDTL